LGSFALGSILLHGMTSCEGTCYRSQAPLKFSGLASWNLTSLDALPLKAVTNSLKSGLFILRRTSNCSWVNKTELCCFSSLSGSFWSFRVLGPSGFLVPPPQLILTGLLGLRWVLPTWSLVLAYGSSWVPSEIPKKWIELNQSSDTTWRAPKSLVRPKLGLSYSHNEIVRNLGHTPNS